MRHQVQQLLDYSPIKYERMIFNHFHQWCHLQSYELADCQKLITNQALFNWWLTQYDLLQRKFIFRTKEFAGRASSQVMRDYHTEIVVQVQDFYSKPLMRKARKQEPINPQLN